MIDLNSLEDIRKLDPKNVFGSTGMFIAQCRQIWQDAKNISFPSEYKDIKNVVICGMEGSAFGAHIALSLLKDSLKVPSVLNSNYNLPAFVDQNSLVILTSYSGSTEETLNSANEALAKKAKITGLTTGKKLGDFLKTNNLPSLIFDPVNNPSGQPRLAPGYSVLGTIALLNKIGLVSFEDQTIENALKEVKKLEENIKKQAKETAHEIFGRIPVILAAEFLEGNAHIIRNQFNETAKSFSAFAEIPELNHHLMEGLKNPPDKKLTVLFLVSNLYSDPVKKRIMLTKDVVLKNNVPVLEYQAKGKDKLTQALHTLSFGGYLTLYLSILYGQDPSVIPWVDYFKQQLGSK